MMISQYISLATFYQNMAITSQHLEVDPHTPKPDDSHATAGANFFFGTTFDLVVLDQNSKFTDLAIRHAHS